MRLLKLFRQSRILAGLAWQNDPHVSLYTISIAGAVCLAVILSYLAPYARAAEIHNAAESGNLGKIKELLQTDPALVNSRGIHNLTPLDYAVCEGKRDVVKFLLDHDADPNVRTDLGGSPLFFAAWYGDIPITRMLLEHEADSNVVNNEGWSPLGLAKDRGFDNVADLLTAHGATLDSHPSIRQWEIADTGVKEPAIIVCRDETSWEKAWSMAGEKTPKKLEGVQQGVAIFAGSLPTGGCRLMVVSAEAVRGRYTVKYKMEASTESAPEAVTTPCVLAIVTPEGLPVDIVKAN